MKDKLNRIMLIDDDVPTNYVHQMVIKQVDCARQIDVFLSANEALTFLSTPLEDGHYPQPDLLFLDINMPGMNGWEFLEAYHELPPEQQGHVVIMMLTTSLNPADHEMAERNPQVTGFKGKPLTREMLREVLQEYFAERL